MTVWVPEMMGVIKNHTPQTPTTLRDPILKNLTSARARHNAYKRKEQIVEALSRLMFKGDI